MDVIDQRALEPRAPGRMGFLFAAIWLVYLAYPVSSALHLTDPPARVFALVLIGLFGVAYVGSFVVFRVIDGIRQQWPRPEPRVVYAGLAVLTALMAAAMIPLGSDAFSLAIYIAAMAAITLPTARAATVVGLLAAAVFALPRLIKSLQPQDFLAFQMIVAAVASWGIGQVIYRNMQLAAAREQLAAMAVAEERLRVGRDVHDILGHSLTVITVKSELARRLLDLDLDRARAELDDIESLAREALAGVRDTVGRLREVSLEGELANARSALTAAGIEAVLPDSVEEVPRSRREIFGWTLREAVTNVVRHSGASRCEVRLSPSTIEISDNGRGPGTDGGEGNGLAGLRERIGRAGGVLRLARPPAGGFLVCAEFPATKDVGRAESRWGGQ
ncbi:two-component system sensor histidine kinase DesK [Rhodococcus sp. OK611]|jgi:two-component system, NarL family, sensor histidine kinase DesK|nr:two-component system sensor histidine kinase DesK [Rhodococcus sp. OK611]SNX91477.1 two-component system, NarL family, sensor histidine kinase DesK [Rhodococcus sp. OK270]